MIIDRNRVEAALPGYLVGAELGAGSFGLVLAGQQRQLHRPVAIKVLSAQGPDGLVNAPGTALDFAAEARVLGRLDHPHVVRAYDYIEAEGLCFVVMELLGGGTLRERRSRTGHKQACALGLAVAAALAHAHSRGVLHRDIKSDNIMFHADGTVKVTDFGIAKLFEGSVASASGRTGTPLYMAPEQINGGHLGPATDIYALGIVLYELLTGHAPFDPRQPLSQLWHQHLSVAPPPMVDVPRPIAETVLRALAKEPGHRQRDARSFALELAGAAHTVYGSGWITRTDLPLYLDDDVRDASAPPPPSPTPNPRSGFDPGFPGSRDGDGGVRLAGRAKRRILAATAAGAVVVGLLVAVVTDVLPGRDDGGSPTGPPTTAAGTDDEAADGDVEPVSEPRLAATLSGPTSYAVWSLSFSPDSHVLATGGRTVTLWDVSEPGQPGAAVEPLDSGVDVRSVAFSPNGHTLATVSDPKTVKLWDVGDSNGVLATGELTGHTGFVDPVAFSPSGTTLAVASISLDGAVRLWDFSGLSPVQAAELPGGTRAVAFSPGGQTLAAADNSGAVTLWDVTDPANPHELAEFAAGVDSLAFSPVGHLLVTGDLAGTARLWDVTDLAAPRQVSELVQPPADVAGIVNDVAFSPDGRALATAGAAVQLWDVRNPARPSAVGEPLDGGDSVYAVAFSPDGRTLATGGYDGTTLLWETG